MDHALKAFGLTRDKCSITLIGNGLINNTWKVADASGEYILQKINRAVFKNPKDIADNIGNIERYLLVHYPEYLFIAAIKNVDGKNYFEGSEGDFYRLMPYVKNSRTITTVENTDQAFEAAKQFGRFTKKLSGFDISSLNITLPDFHNLSLRFEQFETALETTADDRRKESEEFIKEAYAQKSIVAQFEKIISEGLIPKRVIHHDTKISNVLFGLEDKGLCVIDLDTVMPGLIISDLGDMMRTYLSPANEEEKDYSKIEVRTAFFEAIVNGYSSEMAAILTEAERALLIYSGKFMIYMQAIRFLTDYLNGDIYYSTSYAGQNLVRTGNQFNLLNKYNAKESEFAALLKAAQLIA